MSHIRPTLRRRLSVLFARIASLLLASLVLWATPAPAQEPERQDASPNNSLSDPARSVRARRAEEYSESVERPSRQDPPARVFNDADPATILRAARYVYVRTRSVYFKDTELENELRRHPEFHQMGLLVTRDEASADLVIEVGRKVFTTRFVYTVLDARTRLVLMSGKVSSLGGTAADKIAGEFVRKLLAVRPLDPNIKVIK